MTDGDSENRPVAFECIACRALFDVRLTYIGLCHASPDGKHLIHARTAITNGEALALGLIEEIPDVTP